MDKLNIYFCETVEEEDYGATCYFLDQVIIAESESDATSLYGESGGYPVKAKKIGVAIDGSKKGVVTGNYFDR